MPHVAEEARTRIAVTVASVAVTVESVAFEGGGASFTETGTLASLPAVSPSSTICVVCVLISSPETCPQWLFPFIQACGRDRLSYPKIMYL